MSRKSLLSDNIIKIFQNEAYSENLSMKSETTRVLGRKSRIANLLPVQRFQPTFQLQSKNPFNREQCENIINRLMSRFLEYFKYSAKLAPIYCQNISQEINRRLKNCKYDRYRLICVVTICEKGHQSFKCVAKFLWDPETDMCTNITYEMPTFFVIVTVFALYYN